MSWCDKLASTPAAGFRLTPTFTPAEDILGSFTPILNSMIEKDRPTFNVETMEPFSAVFNTEEGYKYSFDHSSISVTYNHRIRARSASGGPPILELISRPAPYTELLKETIERLIATIELLPNSAHRDIMRVGIVSATTVELSDAPPGIATLFDQISSPLGGTMDHMNSSIRTVISQTDKHTDRCVHTFVLPDNDSELVTIQLDWQRVLSNPARLGKSLVQSMLSAATEDALDYFDRVAIGGLGDVGDSDS